VFPLPPRECLFAKTRQSSAADRTKAYSAWHAPRAASRPRYFSISWRGKPEADDGNDQLARAFISGLDFFSATSAHGLWGLHRQQQRYRAVTPPPRGYRWTLSIPNSLARRRGSAFSGMPNRGVHAPLCLKTSFLAARRKCAATESPPIFPGRQRHGQPPIQNLCPKL